MKILTTITFISFLFTAGAQTSVYHPFPDSSAIWTINVGACCYSVCPGPPINPYVTDYNFSYHIGGDTIINSLVYHKLYKNGNAHEYCVLVGTVNNWWYYNNVYIGAYRQDVALKQVYFRYPIANQEFLLYDFNLVVGDTLDTPFISWDSSCEVVTSIDSVLIGNNYRKRFNLTSTITPVSLIEGIGSTTGFFEPLCPFEYVGNLDCFSQNNQTLYPDIISVCEIVSDVNEIANSPQVSISPNPFLNEINIKSTNNVVIAEWNLYNTLGMKVRNEIIHEKEFVIKRNSLASGIYFLQLRSKDGYHFTQKIVAQ